MTGPTSITWRARLTLAGATAMLALIALLSAPTAAQAGVFVSIGGPCCGYWGPGPYAYYPPAPGYYPPPPGYYPPPAGYYPPPSTAAPTGYPAPPAASAQPGYPASPSVAGGGATPQITYTSKPAFTNAAGQTCREYKTNDSGRDVFGTACQQADGQWRVVN